METMLIILAVGALCIVCFFVGAKVGQTVAKDENIKAPSLNPASVIRERAEKKQEEKERARLDVIMQNIDNYNGTPLGQKDVPGG